MRRRPGIDRPSLGLLVAGAALLALSPLALDPSYDWTRHTLSEAGGQAVAGAWAVRSGFLLFGVAVLRLVATARWDRLASACFGWFGFSMLGVAVYSTAAWHTTVPIDAVESWLHSFFATTMGFAFAFGVTARWFARPGIAWRDPIAVVASVALPLGMAAFGGADGWLQRVMFTIAIGWFAVEAWSVDAPRDRANRGGTDRVLVAG